MITLKRIAELANVSVSTASRALNDMRDVSFETRELVLQVAKENDYFQHKKKIRTANKKNKLFSVAIICPELRSEFYAILVNEFICAFEKSQCHAVVYQTDYSRCLTDILFNQCIDDPNIDAIVSLVNWQSSYRPSQIPMVFSGFAEEKISTFEYQYDMEFEQIFGEISSRGIKHIAFVGEPLTGLKQSVFMKRAEKYKFDYEVYSSATDRFGEAGKEAAEYFLRRSELPKVFVCAYDEIAFGMIHQFNKAGINVPNDVAVIGWNDIPTSKYCFGGLSTIHYNTEEVIPKIVKDLVLEKQCGDIKNRHYNISGTLVLRNTF